MPKYLSYIEIVLHACPDVFCYELAFSSDVVAF
jgi:hypothetical protein